MRLALAFIVLQVVLGFGSGAPAAQAGAVTVPEDAPPAEPEAAAAPAEGRSPGAALVTRFEAFAEDGRVYLEWETAREVGTLGFYLYRQAEGGSGAVQITTELLPAVMDAAQGGNYRLLDPGAWVGQVYSYRLEEIGGRGGRTSHGPYRVMAAVPGSRGAAYAGGETERYRTASGEVVYQRAARGGSEAAPLLKVERQPAGGGPAGWGGSVRVPSGAVPGAANAGTVGKFVVTRTGMYYLDAVDLGVALGLSTAGVQGLIGSNGIAVSNREQSVAVQAAAGNLGLYVYAEEPGSQYTTDNVYWVQQGSATVMGTQTGGAAGGPVLGTSYVDVSHAEQNNRSLAYWTASPTSDYWLWDYVWTIDSTRNALGFGVRSDGVAVTGTASLVARFFGISDSGTGKDHWAQVSVKGTVIGEGHWVGRTSYTLTTAAFDPALLVDGSNTVTVTAKLESGVPYSVFYIESFDLSYPRYYRAVGDQLVVRGDGNAVVTVSGFTTYTVRVYDIANPRQPAWLSTVQVASGGGGTYQATFMPVAGDHSYLALTAGAVTRVTTLAADTPSQLHSGGQGAEYIIITTGAMASAAQGLATYRQGQGLQSRVVDVQDIYDEFSDGLVDPQAIRDFLVYAYNNWSPRPRYVLLAGSGSYDYKNYLQTSVNPSLIPPVMVSTPYGLAPADVRYGDILNDDSVPEIAIGRLPVESAAQLLAVIGKMQAYEVDSGSGWSNKVLMIADIDDPGAGYFQADSDSLAGLVPGSYGVQKVYRASYPGDYAAQSAADSAAHTTIVNSIKAGVWLVNYVGHGAYDRFAAPGLLIRGDVAGLLNAPRLPLVSAPTCMVGDFSQPGYNVLGKMLINQGDGGAAGVWAASGDSLNDPATALDAHLFQALFGVHAARPGDAITQTLQAYIAAGRPRFNADIYNFLGDPALVLLSWRVTYLPLLAK